MPRSPIDSRRWTRAARGLLVAPCLWLVATGATGLTEPVVDRPGLDPAQLARFETSVEELRRLLKIPGLSVAIVRDGRLVWARGFGLANVERRIEAAPDTPYHIASVTKPFAAVVVLQLAEEGVLDLDDPVSSYGLDYEGPGVVRVRHLLSHTSHGEPGTEFRYDSERFADLGWVLARASGRSFRQLLIERVLTPLGMENTAPTPLSMGDGVQSPFRVWLDPRNTRVYRRLARPYALDRSLSVLEGHHPIIFSPASGLISSVSDLARLDIALDENRLLPEAARARMFGPTVSPDGRELPYGLGWFSQNHAGTRLVWHYGWNPPTASALYLKLPDEGLTFIALANTDALSRPFELGRADSLVLDSAAALAFYEAFVLEPRRGWPLPPIDWGASEARLVARLHEPAEVAAAEMRERELVSNLRMFHALGQDEQVERLGAVHARLHRGSSTRERHDLPPLGDHLLPWPSVPLFGMGHVAALVWFLVVSASTLAVWTVRVVQRRLGRRREPREAKRMVTGRVTAVLAAVAVLAGLALYVAILSRWPQEGTVAWSSGSPLARSLIVAAGLSGALATVGAIQAVISWRARPGSGLGRVSQLLATSGVCAGAWALLDLAGWL